MFSKKNPAKGGNSQLRVKNQLLVEQQRLAEYASKPGLVPGTVLASFFKLQLLDKTLTFLLPQ